MEGLTLTKTFGPTVLRYIHSTAIINVIVAPFGEGKTFGSVGGLVGHAERCGVPIRAAIVRDTHENIKTSIVKTIQDFFKEYPGILVPRNDWKQLKILTDPPIECDLFGIDDLTSLSKLQGPEYAIIWLEEPAPMADSGRVSAGLSVDVYRAALVRCTRQTGTVPRLQISMNPADEEHWTYTELIDKPAIPDPNNPLITKAVFNVPYGENTHLKDIARQAAMVAYATDPAAYARYVEGKFAIVYRGIPVTPYYRPALHLSPIPLRPVRGLDSFRLWDSWGSPACVMGQQTPTGRIVVLNVCLIKGGSDVRTLMATQVDPLLYSPRWADKARFWRDIGDFTMLNRDQSNVEESSARAIEEHYGTRFEAGPSTWQDIRKGMEYVFEGGGLIKGRPSVVICPVGGKLLDRALRGAWHYPTDSAGNVKNRKPVKDEASHPGDAFANGCCVLRPNRQKKVDMEAYRRIQEKAKQRIMSYATGGARR